MRLGCNRLFCKGKVTGDVSGRHKQILLGVAGGAASAVLTLWLRLYMPATDSFADLRDAPAILLAFFAGPVPALIAGTLATVARVAVGLFGGVGSATWFGSSLATFCATLVAVAAHRWVFLGNRPSFALGAAIAAVVEMLHMAVVLSVGFADFSQTFAVIVVAIPFQCGGVAALVAIASLALNRRQDGRENLVVAALAVSLVTFMILVYFAMAHEAKDVAEGRILLTDDNLRLYPCNLATVLYGIVLSVLSFAFTAYARRTTSGRKGPALPVGGGERRFSLSLRGKFAISLVAMLGTVGGLIGTFISADIRAQGEEGYSESALFVAKMLARHIDGRRVVKYRETGEKDDYYENVRKLLFDVKSVSEVKYLIVIVPDEKGATYIWGTGVSPAGVPDDLGTREEHFEPDEIRMCNDLFRQEFAQCCFIHRTEAYGYLMSAMAPVLGADGKPVALVCVDVSMESVDEQINRVILWIALVTLAIILLCLAGFYFFVSRYIVSPAERQLQAEKERIHAELNVARKIQADALPSVFPAFPGRTDFDIYAMMQPAKAVGGDFYDFFLVDETHLAVVIGDVSDKGVPAALFMMTTKTLVKARAGHGGTPAEILRDVNDRLCEGNRSGMFVTVYLAIVDLKTGEALAANAGHEHPVLRRAGGDFSLVRYRHDPMLGIAPGLKFENRTFVLHPGDTLLVYTDGVTECANERNEFYGMERITDFLNGCGNLPLEALLKSFRADIASHAGCAPQSDDITLLAVTYRGAAERACET